MQITIERIELLALKKLAIVNHALAKAMTDKIAQREQLALTSVLTDVLARADLAEAVDFVRDNDLPTAADVRGILR